MVRFVCADSSWCRFSVSGDMRCSSLSGTTERILVLQILTNRNLCPVFRQNGRKFCFLCLLFLNCLQLKILFLGFPRWCWGFLGGSDGRESAYNAGNLCLISELGRSPEGWHGNPLQYSCLENSMDRGAWQATVHRVTKSWT